MSYQIIWEEKGVFVEFGENASGKEVIKVDDILYSHDNFEKMNYQLWDFTKSKEFIFSDEEMEIIGALDKAASVWNKRMLVTIVAIDNDFRESIEIYKKQIAGIGWACELFDNIDSARKWINQSMAF